MQELLAFPTLLCIACMHVHIPVFSPSSHLLPLNWFPPSRSCIIFSYLLIRSYHPFLSFLFFFCFSLLVFGSLRDCTLLWECPNRVSIDRRAVSRGTSKRLPPNPALSQATPKKFLIPMHFPPAARSCVMVLNLLIRSSHPFLSFSFLPSFLPSFFL